MSGKKPKPDLALITDHGYRCGSCHEPIQVNGGICYGRPAFTIPAINICRKCISIGLVLVGPDPATTKEGRC